MLSKSCTLQSRKKPPECGDVRRRAAAPGRACRRAWCAASRARRTAPPPARRRSPRRTGAGSRCAPGTSAAVDLVEHRERAVDVGGDRLLAEGRAARPRRRRRSAARARRSPPRSPGRRCRRRTARRATRRSRRRAGRRPRGPDRARRPTSTRESTSATAVQRRGVEGADAADSGQSDPHDAGPLVGSGRPRDRRDCRIAAGTAADVGASSWFTRLSRLNDVFTKFRTRPCTATARTTEVQSMTPAACPPMRRRRSCVVLDRSSPVPLYFQVAQQLEEAIERGELLPGQRLENEIDLADRFGLSRPTVRQAIQELVARACWCASAASAPRSCRGSCNRPVELTSLYDDLARTGSVPSTDGWSPAAWSPPTPTVAARLRRRRWARPCSRSSGCASRRDEPLASCATGCRPASRRHERGALATRSLRAAARGRRAHADRHPADRRARRDAGPGTLLRERKGGATAHHGAHDVRRHGPRRRVGPHVYRAQTYSFEITVVGR